MTIAVIPARGGSQRIPRKNIKPFCGKPIIAWSIEAARKCDLFDAVIVSTDDDNVAATAKAHGAEVPFRRPAALSDDRTGTAAVIGHATQWCLDQGWTIDAVCCLYATAPLINPDDLRAGFAALQSGDWEFSFAATDYAAPISRAFSRADDGSVAMFYPEHYETRSQDLPKAYHDAAQFYWGRPEAWLQAKPIFAAHSTAILVPRWRVQDIDEPEDWRRAELIFKLINHD